MRILFYLFLFASVATTYIFWIRPILRQTPSLAEFWASEDSFFAALSEKFAGIKEKLVAAITVIVGGIVMAWDFIQPYFVGVDYTQITSKVPTWAWPLIMMAITSLMAYFRSLADKRD